MKKYFGTEHVMIQTQIDKALKELEDLKCCQNCEHYSMFDGKVECKNCYALNHTNWEPKVK
jgi:predicted transcriptional regulator